jgi:hypothetical protein
MPQAQKQQKEFPGYGVVFPGGGKKGFKVINTFTEAPKKIINPDGSVSYNTPPPTIHELFGGGYVYADGKFVTDRGHLERITNLKMKERALQWFDTHGSAIKPEIVEKTEVGRPEPDFIRSDEIPQESDEVTEQLNNQVQNSLSAIAQSIQTLTSLVQKQDERLTKLETSPQPEPLKRTGNQRKKQSDVMRNKWANPAYREKMMNRIHTKGELDETPKGE